MSATGVDVVQATSVYPPFSLGGTEVYVQSLVAELSRIGIRSSVLVPRPAGAEEAYDHAGARVETYEVDAVPAVGEMRRREPPRHFEGFVERLKSHRGAIYHQHSWTRGCGAHHLRAARELGMRTVLTVHVPGNVCLRGTMMRFGQSPCDGRVEGRRCGACWAQGMGAPRLLAEAAAALPMAAGRLARRSDSRLGSALGARVLADQGGQDLRGMFENADRIVAVCAWLHAALLANGAPPHKLVLNRQGVSTAYLDAVADASRERPIGTLRLLYLGRWNPVKGIDVLVRAMRRLPADLPVELTIRGIPATADERAYEAGVRALAAGDARIVFAPPVAPERLAEEIVGYDALAAPSTWLETGPLVVLEAQAAGLFVLGSRRGGIAELLTDGEDGDLLEPGDDAAWAQAILRLSARKAAGEPLRVVPRPVRTMASVAGEMALLYQAL